jgi:tripartite-type tricarboxylate transporter receptor subunit TctC
MTVLNRPDAAQTIAINYLAQRKGDAHEIGLASGSFINAIARNGSQLHKQVTPLIKLFDAYQGYFTAVDSSIKDMANVRDRLKSDPSSVSFAFPVGLGNPAPCFRCQCRPGGRRPVAEARHGRIQLRL